MVDRVPGFHPQNWGTSERHALLQSFFPCSIRERLHPIEGVNANMVIRDILEQALAAYMTADLDDTAIQVLLSNEPSLTVDGHTTTWITTGPPNNVPGWATNQRPTVICYIYCYYLIYNKIVWNARLFFVIVVHWQSESSTSVALVCPNNFFARDWSII